MNPRFFCREPQYENAIILTYSFDPIFFENVVLPDLWASGVGNIIVIVDKDEIDGAVAKTKGKINQLGRSYRVIKSKTTGIQHSKLILKTGKSDSLLWIGSGNVTSGGWGLNNEIATAWQIETSNTTGSATIGYIRKAISDIVGGITPEIDSVFSAVSSLNVNEIVKTSLPILMSHDRPLAEQLLERWSNASFQRVKILTGSSDKNGALLKWLVENFNVKEAIIGISPEQSSFDPKSLSKLPLKIKILPMPFLPINHAKFIWFEGNKGCRAVMGSANCSAAAWLVPPRSGGNIETIAVYDDCNDIDYEKILSKFSSADLADPADVFSAHHDDVEPTSDTKTPGINIENIQLIRETETVLVTLAKPISGDAIVELEIDDFVIPLNSHNKDNTQWIGVYNKPSSALHTLFGRLRIKRNSLVENSNWQWFDDNNELRHAAKGKQITSTLRNITETLSSNEQKQFVRDIAHVLDVIFTNTPEFSDTPSFTKHIASKTTDEVKLLDPDEIVKNLHDIHSPNYLDVHYDDNTHISLFGIMRYIFSIQDPVIDDVVEDSESEDTFKNKGKVNFHKKKTSEIEREEKQKRKYAEQIVKGISSLIDKRFVDSCTATQLVHAVATLLVLSIKGADGGWLSKESSSKYIQRILDICFLLKTEDTQGILSLIRNRYSTNGHGDIYESIVAVESYGL